MVPTIEEATRMIIMAAYGWAAGGIVFLLLTVYLARLASRVVDEDRIIAGIGAGVCALITLLCVCYVYDGFTNTSLDAKETIAKIEGLRNTQSIREVK